MTTFELHESVGRNPCYTAISGKPRFVWHMEALTHAFSYIKNVILSGGAPPPHKPHQCEGAPTPTSSPTRRFAPRRLCIIRMSNRAPATPLTVTTQHS